MTDTFEDFLYAVQTCPLYDRRIQEILMYKVRNVLFPDYIAELFNFANKGNPLRNADFNTDLAIQQ